jgi:hypothetical protein
MKKKILVGALLIILISTLFILTGCKNTNSDTQNDTENNEVTKVGNLELEVQDISDFSDKLARVKINNKYGYIDTLGNIKIDCIYEDAYNFSEELAAVEKDDKWGFIDTDGNVVIDFKYKKVTSFSDGLSVVGSGIDYGCINKEGNVVLEMKYNTAKAIGGNLICVSGYGVDEEGVGKPGYAIMNTNGETIIEEVCGVNYYSDGLIPVQQLYVDGRITTTDGKWGFIDANGNVVIDYQYDFAGQFIDGLSRVVKDDKYGFIDKNNNIIINFDYPYSSGGGNDFSCGLVRLKDNENVIFKDNKGNTVFKLDDGLSAFAFAEDYAIVKKDDKCGFIDKNGNIVIDCKYTSASDFSDGLAAVSNDDFKSFEFINTKGKTILAGKIVK